MKPDTPSPSASASLAASPAVWLVLLSAAGIFALTMGTRQNMGLFMGSLNTSTGLGVASISLAFAFGQLWWGLTQPFAGAVADRYGAGRVLLMGVLLVAVGTALTPFMTTQLGLIVAIGVLSAGGAGMAGPAVLMSATMRLVPPDKRGLATGVVNAGGSFGQFALAPITAGLLVAIGWVGALETLALLLLLGLPAAWVLRRRAAGMNAGPGAAPAVVVLPVREALSRALRLPSFLLLSAGFLVCGFHVAFLATHLPGVVAACGLPTQYAGWAMAMIGLFNIVGSLAMGWAVGRWRMKSLLALVYVTRAVAVLIFVLSPKDATTLLVFSAVMGFTFLSTVPPTAGLVAKFFGPGNMALLFGVVMLSHQVGGFLGAYLGGRIFDATGSYDWVWYIDIVLAIGAALLHWPIKEAPLARTAAAA